MDAIVIFKVIAAIIALGMILSAVAVCLLIGAAIVFWPFEWARRKLFPTKSGDQ